MQLRRKGRNAYLAEDVDEVIAKLKKELADARDVAFNARRDLGRARSGFDVIGASATASASSNDPAINLEDRHARLIADIAARQRLLAELDAAILARRDYLVELADQLIAWANSLGGQRRRPDQVASDLLDSRVDEYLDATEIDRKSRAFLGMDG